MSKSTSPRAVDSIDWVALLAAVNDERSITPEARELWLQGKWSDPRPSWGRDYLGALQQALARRDISQLLAMLDAAVPLPDCLLPAMAIVLRDLKSGYATGAPAKLTALDDEVIREAFDRMKKWDKSFSVGHAHEYLAEIKGVSIDTIKRSLTKTKPKPKPNLD